MIVSKIVEALLDVDESNGGQKIHAYEGMLSNEIASRAVYATYEYTYPMQLAKLATLIDADFVNKGNEKPPLWFHG